MSPDSHKTGPSERGFTAATQKQIEPDVTFELRSPVLRVGRELGEEESSQLRNFELGPYMLIFQQ